jgi:hypothetical protein
MNEAYEPPFMGWNQLITDEIGRWSVPAGNNSVRRSGAFYYD